MICRYLCGAARNLHQPTRFSASTLTMRLSASLLALLIFFGPIEAATWYFLRYYAPTGSRFTSFSGTMVIPRLPRAGVYYLWPGLQPTDNSGVYQNVLDGRTGSWWIGNGWCCENPRLSWGDGFGVQEGDEVWFENVLSENERQWISIITKTGRGGTLTGAAANSFPLSEFSICSKSRQIYYRLTQR